MGTRYQPPRAGGAGVAPRGGGGPRAAPRPVPHEEMQERLHAVLYDEIGSAVRGVTHQEKNWSESEMVKRIVRYIYKAAGSEELLTLPWDEACRKFLTSAMSAYSGSCQERPWFYDLDLSQTFGRAAWEVLTASRAQPRAQYDQVLEFAEQEYQSWLDETLHNKAMWLSVEDVFHESRVQDKIFTSLKKTYPVALDMVLEDRRPLEELERLQNFLKKWMEDSLSRSWSAVGEPDRYLTEEMATKLFQKLMCPFGGSHPFSCVPQLLTEQIGRPPQNWAFIRQTIRALFRSWHVQSSAGGSKKKRRTGGGGGQEWDAPPPALPRRPGPEDEEDDDGPDGAGPLEDEHDDDHGHAQGHAHEDEGLEDEGDLGGHPDCTSQEDCQGSVEDVLIRHILNGKPGDIYCKTCWESFLQQNPHLEGVEE